MMTQVLVKKENKTCVITLNRMDKSNAFNDEVISILHEAINTANQDEGIRLIWLNANGKHFSAGADLAWMKKMGKMSHQENIADANKLANLMHAIYQSPIPVICSVKGMAMGGGAGLIAASDIVIGASDAKICFSEVKLGLIPAVISPYVIRAIGIRATKWLFLSAELINSDRAYELGLFHYQIDNSELTEFSLNLIKKIENLGPQALKKCKYWLNTVEQSPLDETLIKKCAHEIATIRMTDEAQHGLDAFLNKQKPTWT